MMRRTAGWAAALALLWPAAAFAWDITRFDSDIRIRRDGCGSVAHGIGKNEIPAMDEGSAAVHHIGHVAFSAHLFRNDLRECLNDIRVDYH